MMDWNGGGVRSCTSIFAEGLYLDFCAGVPRVPIVAPLLMGPVCYWVRNGLKSQSVPCSLYYVETSVVNKLSNGESNKQTRAHINTT